KWADALVSSLQELGWKQGGNLQIEMRWGGSDVSQIQKAAKELVTLDLEVIETSSTLATAAVLATKTAIPLVFSAVQDPIGSGFVTNLARPNGNVKIPRGRYRNWRITKTLLKLREHRLA